MWEKNFRIVTFAAVYEAIYGINNDHSVSVDMESIAAIAESYEIELTQADSDRVMILVKSFQDNKTALYDQLEQYSTSWSKTYDLVKAIMCTALLEYEEIKGVIADEDKKKVVNKYVQIAQEMIGGKNPSLVFAIVGKIYGI
jgi:transcription termination factor NusB